jgi:uncharacterized protein
LQPLYWQIKGEQGTLRIMPDTEEQLARLRQRIAAIDSKFLARKNAAPVPMPPPDTSADSRSFIEEWAEGQVVSNEWGEHFQMERLFPSHKPHGSADVGALLDLPHELLDTLSNGEIVCVPPERWAFLDTETTGLAGGSGTYAFLIGVGRITREGFRVRQFFMREYAEERSVLGALNDHLDNFDVLITYNGCSYDQPLLETRYRMTRHKPPFGRLNHLDLLFGARRIWKLRLENCRLVQLEHQILGVLREGDLAGELIPYVYFEYLRSKQATRLVPIFHHNAIDILSLACLTAIVPAAFRSTDSESLTRLGVRRGEDLTGIARWLIAADEPEQGLALLKRAVDTGLPDRLMFRSLWDIACLEKKLERVSAALGIWAELAGCRNEFRVPALVELAKYYEHNQRNYAMALEWTQEALKHDSAPALRHRCERLQKRMSRPRPRRLI